MRRKRLLLIYYINSKYFAVDYQILDQKIANSYVFQQTTLPG